MFSNGKAEDFFSEQDTMLVNKYEKEQEKEAGSESSESDEDISTCPASDPSRRRATSDRNELFGNKLENALRQRRRYSDMDGRISKEYEINVQKEEPPTTTTEATEETGKNTQTNDNDQHNTPVVGSQSPKDKFTLKKVMSMRFSSPESGLKRKNSGLRRRDSILWKDSRNKKKKKQKEKRKTICTSSLNVASRSSSSEMSPPSPDPRKRNRSRQRFFPKKRKNRKKSDSMPATGQEKKPQHSQSGPLLRRSTPSTDDSTTLPIDLQSQINQFQLEGYAEKFFSKRKKRKGLFKKKVPLTDMLAFESQPLQSSLTALTPELMSSAIDVFNMILQYQGVSGKTGGNLRVACDIVTIGIREGQLRDEIYCQICKQLTNTPDREIQSRGWELMVFSCLCYPPTINFESWLRKFIDEHIKLENCKEAEYAQYSQKHLDNITASPPTGRVPSLVELERIRSAALGDRQFGVTLEHILEKEQKLCSDYQIPDVLKFLCKTLLKTGGTSTVGIFRVKGNNAKVYEHKAGLECGLFEELEIENPHECATLIKLWFRELKEPIIPLTHYDEIIKYHDNKEEALRLVQQLDEPKRQTLEYMIEFIQENFLTDTAIEQTNMNLVNISVILTPSFIRNPHNDPSTMLANKKKEQNFVQNLFMYYNK